MKRIALERLPHLLIIALVTFCGVQQVNAAGPQLPNDDYDPTGPPDNCCPFETRVGSYPLGTGWEEAHAAVDAGFYFGSSDAGTSVLEDAFYWPIDTNLQIYTDTRDVDVCVDESDPQSSLLYTATRPSWTVTPPSGRAYVAAGNQLNYRPQVTGL